MTKLNLSDIHLKLSGDLHLDSLSSQTIGPLTKTLQKPANVNYLDEFVTWVKDPSLQVTITEWHKQSQQNKCAVLIVSRDSQIAGLFKLMDIDHNKKTCELGYLLLPHFSKQGIAQKACQALIEVAFQELKMNQIDIWTFSTNLPSQRLLKRLGANHVKTSLNAGLHNDKPYDDQLWVIDALSK